MTSIESREDLRLYLDTDLAAAELKFALFSSALSSYKRDFLLRPFPSHYKRNDHKDFKSLSETVNKIGRLKNLDVFNLTDQQFDLLKFVLENRKFRPKLVPSEKFKELKSLAKQQQEAPEPNFVFQIEYPDDEESRTSTEDTKHIYAYHGSQLSNFYSILHNGLRSNMNKTSAFGEGTYLSSELNVSLNWSLLARPGSAHCGLGSRLSCVAFCRVKDDPKGVTYKTEDRQVAGRSSFPEKYILVKNDTLVSVDYLLVYAEHDAHDHHDHHAASRMRRFFWRHRFWLMMFAYFVVLLAVGLANSSDFKWYIRRWSAFNEHDFQTHDDT